MHFAYPPRKSSTPPKFVPRSSTSLPLLRRGRAKIIALVGLVFIVVLYLLTRTGGRRHALARHTPSGKPPVVIVTVIDQAHHYPPEYLDAVRENRIQYAEKHGNYSGPASLTFWLRLLTTSCLGQATKPFSPS